MAIGPLPTCRALRFMPPEQGLWNSCHHEKLFGVLSDFSVVLYFWPFSLAAYFLVEVLVQGSGGWVTVPFLAFCWIGTDGHAHCQGPPIAPGREACQYYVPSTSLPCFLLS